MIKTPFIASILALALAIPAFGRGSFTPSQRGGYFPGDRGTGSVQGRTVRISGTTNRPAVPMNTGRQVPLNSAYSILNTVSIFSIDRGASTDNTPRNIRPDQPPPPPPVPAPVFRASMVDDIGPMALLEVTNRDGSTANIYLREGQVWNNNKVLSITLNTLKLARDGVPSTSVAIGDNLDGVQVGSLPATATYQSADAAGTTSVAAAANSARNGRTFGNFRGNFAAGLPTSTLASSAQDPPLPPGSTDDIASRMAARRLSQLGGITAPAPIGVSAAE